ncbi:Blue-light-activated histidine kinase 1 [Tsuneonella dongtanensis]|uniref:histidine kinase n=1 Tax=Tsuneonella dongtanensis TaxID=692370 RepID=A0A1B2ADQ8_9SPHN|nr:PAS domain-containing protein [Tsuneonella dongtanensis]ANY20274.1 Blue-light-activated histidine kinase 1 [Tsuneonella dongtanensis]
MNDASHADVTAFLASEAGFRVLTDTMPHMVWSTLPDGYHDYYNAQWYAFTGVPQGSTDGEEWNGMFHPDDQDRAWERWRHSLETGEPYEIEYRLRRHDGEYRWTLGRALPVRENGKIVRWIGTCTDIHDAKSSADQLEVLSRELSHRIKNIFSVIIGLIELTKRTGRDGSTALGELSERILSLSRAHNFARPHSEQSQPKLDNNELHGLLVELLAPYRTDDDRIRIVSDTIPLDDRGATPIALVVHELATNSAKYGALSSEDGSVELRSTLDHGQVSLHWTELGGPPISGPPETDGFGSRLIKMSVERQLAGSLSKDWLPEGLRVVITVPQMNLCRSLD